MAPHVRPGALTLVMDSERVLATDIHAVWPRTRHPSAKMRVAIDALATQIPAMISYPNQPAAGNQPAARRPDFAQAMSGAVGAT